VKATDKQKALLTDDLKELFDETFFYLIFFTHSSAFSKSSGSTSRFFAISKNTYDSGSCLICAEPSTQLKHVPGFPTNQVRIQIFSIHVSIQKACKYSGVRTSFKLRCVTAVIEVVADRQATLEAH
tara:strand:- start:518 stop:895 length:378 start_codon:yes stop_codon:yes gene_type:complete